MKRIAALTIVGLGALLISYALAKTDAGDFTVRSDSAGRAADSAGVEAKVAGDKASDSIADSTGSMAKDTITTESGLKYIVHHEGSGPAAKRGQRVSVHYRGVLENGNEFDNSYKRKAPIQFPLGRGRVIKGWDEGILGMRVGEARTLIIPGKLAYGERGMPAAGIGPNATLIFDVELVAIK
ncbi:MAG: FKBP-type peptidyl-prolyl cis-trans isomerase [Candidatus Zixiibacteriota bacterium]